MENGLLKRTIRAGRRVEHSSTALRGAATSLRSRIQQLGGSLRLLDLRHDQIDPCRKILLPAASVRRARVAKDAVGRNSRDAVLQQLGNNFREFTGVALFGAAHIHKLRMRGKQDRSLKFSGMNSGCARRNSEFRGHLEGDFEQAIQIGKSDNLFIGPFRVRSFAFDHHFRTLLII